MMSGCAAHSGGPMNAPRDVQSNLRFAIEHLIANKINDLNLELLAEMVCGNITWGSYVLRVGGEIHASDITDEGRKKAKAIVKALPSVLVSRLKKTE